jgi:hypothetical protein
MTAWNFSSLVHEERANALRRGEAFSAVVEAIARDMEVVCCHRRDCDDMAGFSRVVFNLRVPPPTFDVFFNSEHGYRGAYFESPHTGLAANEACIRHLTPLLLAWAKQYEPSLDQVFAQESLRSPTAKVWLTEFESHLCAKCVGEWGNPDDELPEILNGRWEVANSSNGRRGRKAPALSKLRVFGAFLSERYDEFTPTRKRFRAQQLNACGWS